MEPAPRLSRRLHIPQDGPVSTHHGIAHAMHVAEKAVQARLAVVGGKIHQLHRGFKPEKDVAWPVITNILEGVGIPFSET